MNDKLTPEQLQNLVATAISAGGRLQFGVVAMQPGAIETFAREIQRRTADFYNNQRTNPSSLYTEGRDVDGRVVLRGTRTSADPSGDHMLMDGFLTMEQAHRIRGVPIAHKLGSLYVVAKKPETFDADAVENLAWRAPSAEEPGNGEAP
ncbi:hypothetical protein D3C87_988330 [compost metagenome]